MFLRWSGLAVAALSFSSIGHGSDLAPSCIPPSPYMFEGNGGSKEEALADCRESALFAYEWFVAACEEYGPEWVPEEFSVCREAKVVDSLWSVNEEGEWRCCQR